MNKTNELCEMELTADTEERLSVLKKKLGATDRYIQQDNRDLAELESRYEKLDISYPVRRFLDDYIACMQTKYERLADLCYLAGVSGSDVACGMTSGRDIGAMIHGGLLNDLLYYKLAVMNGQGLNIKDKNNQKDIIGNLMVNPLKWLSVGGSFIKGTGHAVADSEITGIPAGENYTKNRWSIGGIITASPFSLRSEYLAGKDGTVKSDGFYATGSCRLLRNFDLVASYDYFNADKAIGRKQTNYIAGLQYWFYPKCRLQAQYTFCDRNKGKDSNLFQAQVQVRF